MRIVITVLFVVSLLASNANSQSFVYNRMQTISNIFEIPIQTLTAISKLLQGTRPLGSRIQAQQNQTPLSTSRPYYQYNGGQYSAGQYSGVQYSGGQYNGGQYSGGQSNRVQYNRKYRSRAARIAGLYTAADGSGFKI